MGNPSMVHSLSNSLVKPTPVTSRPGQQSLAASIASIGIGMAIPRTKQNGSTANTRDSLSTSAPRSISGGASYASALRIGATAEESETAITDQRLMGSLQSDLSQVWEGGIVSLQSQNNYNSTDINSYFYRGLDAERPLRSHSEPVIQLPESMASSDYFSQGRGVGALGGGFNRQAVYSGQSSPLKPIGSPLASTLPSLDLTYPPLPSLDLTWPSAPPSVDLTSALSSLDLTWLSSPSSKPLEPSMLDMLHGSNNGTPPPLSLPTPSNMDIMMAGNTNISHQQKQSYFQGQQGLNQSPYRQIEASHIPSGGGSHIPSSSAWDPPPSSAWGGDPPSSSAWAAMLMTHSPLTTSPPLTPPPSSPQHEQQQYFNQLGLQNQMAFNQAKQQKQQQQAQQEQQQQISHQSINNQHDYIYQRQQLQQLQQQQHFSEIGNPFNVNAQQVPTNGIAFNSSVPQGYSTGSGSGLGMAASSINSNIAGLRFRSESDLGAASRSGSEGMTSLSSGVTDREDLFNYDDLSPQASEFEPQKHSYKAW